MKWKPISITPPDKLLKVRDELYNEGKAYPIYYSDGTILPEDKRIWGWSVCAEWFAKNPIKGTIKQWKEL